MSGGAELWDNFLILSVRQVTRTYCALADAVWVPKSCPL